MPKAPAQPPMTIDACLEAIAASLHEAAQHLSDDAAEAVTQAANSVTRAGQSLRTQVAPAAKRSARKVVEGVKEHPVATLTAGIIAVAALIGAVSAAKMRSSKS